MARPMFDANNSTISIIREEIEGQAPMTGTALILEPNSIDNFGNSTESTSRQPLSTSRDAKKGTITSITSTVELSQDFTISAYKEMMSSACSANWVGTNNLEVKGGTIYDVIKNADKWEFKIKKPFSHLPTTAKLITSGFLDESRNGELEIKNNLAGILEIANNNFNTNKNADILDPNGKIHIEWEDIVPKSVNTEKMLVIPDGIGKTLEIGAKAILDGFANNNNNGEFIITDIVTANNTLKLYPELVEETEAPIITTPGNTIDIYSGALTGDNAETVNVTISAAGTYNITIGSITSTVSGTQTIKINANATEIVNETREFANAGDTLNNIEVTFNKTAGQETITNITLIGSNLSANNVVITYKENDIVEPVPVNRKMYVSMECKNWIIKDKKMFTYNTYPFLMKFAGYKNDKNNGIKSYILGNDTDDFFQFQSTTPVVEEKVDIMETETSIIPVGIIFQGNIDEAGNLKFINNDVITMQSMSLLLKGSAIWLGGATPETQFEDEFANGLARIKNYDADTKTLYLDKRILPETDKGIKHIFIPDTDDQLANKEIPIFVGQFLRTYPVGDKNYKRISHTLELKTTNDEGKSFYEYSVGNLLNTLEIGMPSQEKATLNVNFSSRKALDAVTTPLDWKREQPEYNKVMSTPSDVLRTRVHKLDDSGLATVWTDATLNINNNISQEYAIGSLSPISVSQGNLEISLSGNLFFDNHEVMNAITNNCTTSSDMFLTNEDGGVFIDIPSSYLSDGNRDFTNNEKIKQSLTVNAYLEKEWDYSISSTFFPYLPTEKENVCK